MSNEEFEFSISNTLKSIYRLNIEAACFAAGFVPKHILLDRTRNIHSYFLFLRTKDQHIITSICDTGHLKDGLINVLRTQYSQLDRPLFLIIQDNDKSLKVIEGNFVREKLLEAPNANIEDFLLSNAENFNDIIYSIKKEL
ncbi:MAG: hypothetical protein LBS69_00575 [Prevotellaceae bacterium]|jgi:hypothetical protein|nr:hypothetical protein [Prevotellaceae bacterium]